MLKKIQNITFGESFGDLDIRIRRGLPFDTNAKYQMILGRNKQHNRSNTINFNNIITHLNLSLISEGS